MIAKSKIIAAKPDVRMAYGGDHLEVEGHFRKRAQIKKVKKVAKPTPTAMLNPANHLNTPAR